MSSTDNGWSGSKTWAAAGADEALEAACGFGGTAGDASFIRSQDVISGVGALHLCKLSTGVGRVCGSQLALACAK